MTREGKIATVTLSASIGLHLGLLTVVSQLWHEPPRPVQPLTTRYVVRMQSPVSAPAPVLMPPVSESVQPVAPLPPTAMPDALQPQRLQPPQPRPAVAPRQVEASVRPIELQKRPLPRPLQPRKPVAQPAPTPLRPPRPISRTAAVVPQAPVPAEPYVAKRSQPMQPTTAQPQPMAAPSRPEGSEAKDIMQAYLAQVFAALERHKYYPAAARRRRLSGRVVLQFVILPDGQVVDPHITEQQGSALFREAVLTALRRASPLPEFPSNLRQSKLFVKVPVVYDLLGER